MTFMKLNHRRIKCPNWFVNYYKSLYSTFTFRHEIYFLSTLSNNKSIPININIKAKYFGILFVRTPMKNTLKTNFTIFIQVQSAYEREKKLKIYFTFSP